jgi:hypothetical protein
MYVCMYVCMLCMYVWRAGTRRLRLSPCGSSVYVCMYVCVYVCIHVLIYKAFHAVYVGLHYAVLTRQ